PVATAGRLAMDLAPVGAGTQPLGSDPQICADTAAISGTGTAFVAIVDTSDGLFADSYFWDNVIDANAMSGKFATCNIGGAYANTLFLGLTCLYESDGAGVGNMDIGLKRIPFNVPGPLNQNGTSTAT